MGRTLRLQRGRKRSLLLFSTKICQVSSSMEEHLICNQDAAGSSPVLGSSRNMVSTSKVDNGLAKPGQVKL